MPKPKKMGKLKVEIYIEKFYTIVYNKYYTALLAQEVYNKIITG